MYTPRHTGEHAVTTCDSYGNVSAVCLSREQGTLANATALADSYVNRGFRWANVVSVMDGTTVYSISGTNGKGRV